MPVKTSEERTLLSRIGGYAKWAAADNPTLAAAAAQRQREARAQLDAMIARRHLVDAAQAYAGAEQALRDLGLLR